MDSFISFKKDEIEKLLRMEVENITRNLLSNDNFLRVDAMCKFNMIDRLRVEMGLDLGYTGKSMYFKKVYDYYPELRHRASIELENYPFHRPIGEKT